MKTKKLEIPVISVGNLALGGTGKTPVVEYLIRFFIKKELKPAVLSRGYGRYSKTSVAIVSDGKNILLKPEEAGDEPYLLSENNPTVPIIVGKNRFEAGKTAIKKFKPDVLILDDGFQHLSLARDLNIVLINCIKPLGNGHIFPTGSLREFPSALKRANIILYTHSDEAPDNSVESLPAEYNILKPKTVHTFENIVRIKDQKTMLPEELKDKKIVVFCGIGEPGSFRKKIEQYGAEIVHYRDFTDHYDYKLNDLQFLQKTAENLKVDFILTTRKDSVKIKDMAAEFLLIWAVNMKIEFRKGEEKFQEALLSCVKE